MVIYDEKAVLKTANDAITKIAVEMQCLSIALKGLEIIFFDNAYKKKEAKENDLKAHLEVYKNVHANVLSHLANIELAVHFLRSKAIEKPPIAVNRDGLLKVQKWAAIVKRQIDLYERKIIRVKHLMPHLDAEVKRLSTVIQKVNDAIGEMNERNKPCKLRPYPLIKNPFV